MTIVELLPNLIAVKVPNKTKRESIGKYCKDSEVRWQITNLCHKPFLNFHNIKEDQSSAQRGYCGVIYNVELPDNFSYTLIGEAKSVSEEVAAGLLPKFQQKIGRKFRDLFKMYTLEEEYTSFAPESLHSLLQSKECYLENPYGKEPTCENWTLEYDKLESRWLQAQERTGNWLLIERKPLK